MSHRVAKLAPPSRAIASLDTVIGDLNELLLNQFCLQPLPRFCAFVEGVTDVDYLQLAVQLHQQQTGEDLLAVPKTSEGNPVERIRITTPGLPNNPNRGGCPQMVRLAKELAFYVFRLQIVDGIVFVFDHDDAGIKSCNELDAMGYEIGRHRITLDPKEHPNACYNKGIVVEDLLSLGIQEQFFQQQPAWCDVRYENGVLRRFTWRDNSKYALRDFVKEHGQLCDMSELVSLVKRIRRSMGWRPI